MLIPAKRFHRIFGLIFILGVFVMGAALFYYSLSRVLLVYRTQNWTATSGSVISSEVCYRRGIKSDSYSPRIVYRYAVDGKEYESREITYGFTEGSKDEAAEKVAQYPAGSEVKVFYNPSSPGQACLERGGAVNGFAIPLIVSFIFMGAAIWLANRERKKKKRLYRPFLN